MRFGWPQVILFFLATISFAEKCYKSGQPREPFNAAYGLIDYVSLLLLLWWGGFFE